MKGSFLVALVLLAIGVGLLVWGFNASESLSSEVSETVQGAPSNKAIALMAIGALFGVVGLVKLLKRA